MANTIFTVITNDDCHYLYNYHLYHDYQHSVRTPDMGAAVQLMGIIRTLLDPENMLASVNKSEKTDFLNYFYKHCMHVFIGTDMYRGLLNSAQT